MVPPETQVNTYISADSWTRMASGSSVTLTSVNEYGTIAPSVDPEDPNGYLYVIGMNGPDIGRGAEATPSPPGNMDAVWTQCMWDGGVPNPTSNVISEVGPAGDESSALFLTVTSTLHEDSAPSTASTLDLGGLVAPTAAASATLKQPSVTASPTTSDINIVSELQESSRHLSWTVDGVAASSPNDAPASATADVSFSFPTQEASGTKTEDSDSVGIDLGFTKPTNSQPQTIGIDLGPSTADSAQSGTPAGSPAAGTPAVSADGFNTGFGPHTDGPTLVLTEVGGSLVLSTIGSSSAPATTASAESNDPETTKSAQPEATAGTTAPSEPEAPEQTSAAPETDAPTQSSEASGSGLPVVTTAVPQGPASTAVAVSLTPIEVGGITVSQNSDTQLVVGSQTLAAGSSVIVGSGSSTTAVVLQTEGGSPHIVAGTATAPVPNPASAEPEASTAPAAPFEVGGVTASQNSASEIVVGTQTIAPGSSIIVGSGSSTTAVVLQTDGGATHLIVGSSTAAIPTAPAAAPETAAPAPFTVAGVTVSQNSASDLVIGTHTLAPGSSIVLGSGSSTTAVALQTNDGTTQLVVGSSTAAIPTAAAAAAPIVVGSQTLTPGSTITVGSGTQTTALVLSTNAAGSSAIVVADASTTYTIDAPSAAATNPPATTTIPTTGAHLITTGATTELVVGKSTYTFKTGGPSIGLVTKGGTTIVVAGESGGSRTSIPIPTSEASSSTSTTRAPSVSGDGLSPSSGLGGGVGWATTSASAAASSTGAAASVAGWSEGGGLIGLVCAVLGLVAL